MEKQLPHSVDAEIGILGSVMLRPEALYEIADTIKPEDFYREAHRLIYQVMVDLYEHEDYLDPIMVSDELERRGHLDLAGGSIFIGNLINQELSSYNISHYAHIVAMKAKFRKSIHLAGELAAAAYSEDAAGLTEVEGHLQDLDTTKATDFVSMNNVMSSYMTGLDSRHENRKKGAIGISTGSRDLDAITKGFQPGEMTILAARPAMGKTAMALNWVRAAALKQKKMVAIFSLEMSKEQLAGRLLSGEAKVPQDRLKTGWVEEEDWDVIPDASARLCESKIWIADQVDVPVTRMRAMCKRLKATQGLDLIVIDYLQLMESGKSNSNRTTEVGEISRGLKKMAIELNVSVIALAQLSRGVESRQSKVPQLSDLRESGSIENDADVVMFIYRDDYYNPDSERKNMADIHIAKHRNGPLGFATQFFNGSLSTFNDLEIVP